jgi:membrane protein DedA with SNARE-associated domain
LLPLLNMLLQAASDTAEKGWVASWIDRFFDPAWNIAHGPTIWAVILVILVSTGVGLPTPEDIWLTLAGFSAYKQAGDRFVWYYFVAAFCACTTANLIGDSGAWWLGRRYGFAIRDRFKFMRRLLNEKRMIKVQGWFDNYGNWTVFFGRQLAGIRFVSFFTAGTMRVPWHKFVLFDFLGCFVSIPVWLTLGALAAIYGKEWLQKASSTAGGSILGAAVVAIVIFLVVVKIRANRRAREAEKLLAADVPLGTDTAPKAKASAPAAPVEAKP